MFGPLLNSLGSRVAAGIACFLTGSAMKATGFTEAGDKVVKSNYFSRSMGNAASSAPREHRIVKGVCTQCGCSEGFIRQVRPSCKAPTDQETHM